MRQVFTAAIAILVLGTEALAQGKTPPSVPIPDVVPKDGQIDGGGASYDGRHMYYYTKGEVWLYNRDTHVRARVLQGDLWDVNVGANGAALAYTKTGERPSDEFVWTLPLDSKTGLPNGPERRVSTVQGDVPAVSPDGKWVAFAADTEAAGGQALVVVPAMGGPERMLAPFVSKTGIGSISWTPDSKALYYGLNAPNNHRSEPSQIRRVSLNGGPSTLIAHGGNAWPLLSPDGRLIAYRDTGVTNTFVIADTLGRRLATVSEPPAVDVLQWIGNTNLLLASGNVVRRARMYSLADGASRVVIDSTKNLWDPEWSPDGTQFVVTRPVGEWAELLLVGADGRGRRSIRLSQFGAGNFWSPDGRWVAYRGALAGGNATVSAVDVTTGHEVAMAPIEQGQYVAVSWSADSRHVLTSSAGRNSEASQRLQVTRVVKESDLDGHVRILREVKVDGVVPYAWAMNDSMLIVTDGTSTRAMPLRTNAAGVQLLPPSSFVSVPSFSADGKWVAFRRNPVQMDNTHMNILEVMQVDGSHHTTITLPFNTEGGERNPQFLPAAHQLVVHERPSGNSGGALYLVTLPGGALKKLFDVPPQPHRQNQWSLSPDGRSIVYVTTDSVPVNVFSTDISSLLPALKR